MTYNDLFKGWARRHEVAVAMAMLVGCGAPAPDQATPGQPAPTSDASEPEPETPNPSAYVKALGAGALQAERMGALALASGDAARAVFAADEAVALERLTSGALAEIHERVLPTAVAVDELQRTMVNVMLPQVGPAVTQLLSRDPIRGPLAAPASFGPNGVCGTVRGFDWGRDLREPNPPFARLEVLYDGRCGLIGLVRYELRREERPNGSLEALRLVLKIPGGMAVRRLDGMRRIERGGSMEYAILFDGTVLGAVPRFVGLEVRADYCSWGEDGGIPVCVRDASLAVQAGISFFDEPPEPCPDCEGTGPLGLGIIERMRYRLIQISVDASLSVEAFGRIETESSTVTWGVGQNPMRAEIAFDQGTVSVSLSGESSKMDGSEMSGFSFEGLPSDPATGLRSELNLGALTLTGCTTSFGDVDAAYCAEDLGLSVSLPSSDIVRIEAGGGLTTTIDADVRSLTIDDVRLDLTEQGVFMNGEVAGRDSAGETAFRFEGLSITAGGVSGGFGLYRDDADIIGVEFCAGTGLAFDAQTVSSTLSGCLEVVLPERSLSIGARNDPVEIYYRWPVSFGLDGAVVMRDANDTETFSLQARDWTLEMDLSTVEDDTLQFRMTGSSTVSYQGLTGSVAIDRPFDVQLVGADSQARFTFDGQAGVALTAGALGARGTISFEGLEMTLIRGLLDYDLVGAVTLAFAQQQAWLPAADLRMQIGEPGTPFTVRRSTTEAELVLDGDALVGLECESGTCDSSVQAELSQVAIGLPLCGDLVPHAGTASLSGLPLIAGATSAFRVSCDCNNRGRKDWLIASSLTMRFSATTPDDGIAEVLEAEGLCMALRDRTPACTAPGTTNVAPSLSLPVPDIAVNLLPWCGAD